MGLAIDCLLGHNTLPPATAPIAEAVSSSSSAHQIDKLTGQENFTIWCTRMIKILGDLGFYDIIDSTSTLPSDEDEQTKWNSKNRKALSAIRLHCLDPICHSPLRTRHWRM
jgi:hypothetical protein